MISRRRAALLASAAILFWLCRRAYYVGFFNDDAFYWIGARSLLTGRYAELQAPGAPPLVNYLPGWPLMLAPITALSRESLVAAQAFAVFLHVAALGLLATVFEREEGAETADLALAALALSPLIASTAATLLSDGPMLFCAAAALAAAARLWPRRDVWPWFGFGLALGLAALVRPTGLTLAAAFAFVLARERRPRDAALVFLPASAIFIAWLWRDAALSGTAWNYWRETVASARGGGISALANALFGARELFARALWRPPVVSSTADAAIALAGAGLCAVGLTRARTPAGRVAAIFAALFFLPHLFWAKQAARYLIPILPFALWGAWRGLAFFSRPAAIAGATLGVAFSGLATARVVAASWRPSSPLNVPPARSAAWLRVHAAGATLAAEYDARWNLLTGLSTAHIPYDVRAPERFERFLNEARPGFVLVENLDFSLRPAGGAYAALDAEGLRGLLLKIRRARFAWSDATERVEIWRVDPP